MEEELLLLRLLGVGSFNVRTELKEPSVMGINESTKSAPEATCRPLSSSIQSIIRILYLLFFFLRKKTEKENKKEREGKKN
jgi:hypothetical protein